MLLCHSLCSSVVKYVFRSVDVPVHFAMTTSTCLLSYRCIVYCTIDVLREIQNPNKIKIDGCNKRTIKEIASQLILIDFLPKQRGI